jgi:hypothetical protein
MAALFNAQVSGSCSVPVTASEQPVHSHVHANGAAPAESKPAATAPLPDHGAAACRMAVNCAPAVTTPVTTTVESGPNIETDRTVVALIAYADPVLLSVKACI